MKKTLKNILFGAILFLTISCEDFLSPEIDSSLPLQSFGSTPVELDFLLAEAYVKMRDNSYLGMLLHSIFTTDFTLPTSPVLGRSPLARMEQDATDGESYEIWSANYNVIAIANLVIEKADQNLSKADSLNTSKAAFSNLAGQARFIRALSYFNLVRIYHNVPIIEKYFTTFAEIENVSNAPADKMKEQERKVYDFIVNDLVKASALLNPAPVRGRSNKYAAQGLLAKVYLNMATIAKYRDKTAGGLEFYNKSLVELNSVINSGIYGLKRYFPDNFIRANQYSGPNEFLFSLEWHELDKSGSNWLGNQSGFLNNTGAGTQVNFGVVGNNASSAALPNDFGFSTFDGKSPGDIVRRFWTFEDGDFVTLDANGNKIRQNTPSDCINGQGPGCEIFLVSKEPFEFTRPYWFEVVDEATSFRSNPTAADVVTFPDKSTAWKKIWSNGSATASGTMRLVKFRRTPVTQPLYSDVTYDADYAVMRYAEVLLMYAEVANELVDPNSVPVGGKLTATDAVNLIRDRARNFVFYNDLSVTKRIIDNSPYTTTYGDVFSRVPKIGKNPAKTANAADTLAKYYNMVSAFRGLREVPSTPVIRNFKEFPLTRNFVPDFPMTLSKDAFRESLLDERWRELAGESGSRWFDLTRYGTLISRIQTNQRTLNTYTGRDLSGTQYFTAILRQPSEKYNYLPIPLIEINLNPKLNQNLGY